MTFDDGINLISNKIITSSENLLVDPALIQTSSGTWFMTYTEIKGTINNNDPNVPNGFYTVHCYQSSDLKDWVKMDDILSANDNLEDIDFLERNGTLYYLYEKETVDKGLSSICMKKTTDDGITWSEEEVLIPPLADNEYFSNLLQQ